MSAPAKTNEIDPLLHPAQVAKLLGVSLSWLAKSRLNGTGPRFIKIGRAVRYAHVRRARVHPEPAADLDQRDGDSRWSTGQRRRAEAKVPASS